MSIDKTFELCMVPYELGDTGQVFDEALTDFDAVTPAWDGEVDAVADFDATTDADSDMNDAAGEGHDGGNAIEFTFDDNNVAYGTINADAVNQTSGVFTFWINTNDVAIQASKNIRILSVRDGADAEQWYINLYNNAGTLELRTAYKDDADNPGAISTIEITAVDHKIDFHLSASTGAGNDDGWLRLYVDDVLEYNDTGHDNDTKDWDYARVGICQTSSTTFGGSFLIDTIKVDPVGGPMLDTLAAQNGTYGISIPIIDTTDRYCSFTDPDAETQITAECEFDPNSLTMGAGESFIIIGGDAGADFRVNLNYSGGYYIQGVVYVEDGAGYEVTSSYTITDAPHKVRLVWQASSADGADDGYMKLYIDEVLMETLSGLDNDTKNIGTVQFGGVGGIDAGTYGIFYMDDCKWGWEIDEEWTDITADVLRKYSHSQGISGSGPTSLVASPGMLEFKLNNSVANSAGKAGYYSPEHADVFTIDGSGESFDVGVEVRVKYDDVYFWRGKIHSIKPFPDQYNPFVEVTAHDWMMDAQTQKIKSTPVETDVTADEAIATLVALLPSNKQPNAVDYDAGASTFPYIFDSERDEKNSLMSVMQKIAQSELGKFYVNHQDSDGELLKFANRQYESTTVDIEHDFSDDQVDVEVDYSLNRVKTKVITKSYPREVDAADGVLGQIRKSFSVGAGATKTQTIYFRDPSSGDRISALSLAARVSGTDYIANADEDGGGADRTADITVTQNDVSGNSITLDIENTSGTLLWVTTLQQKGKGIKLYDPGVYEAESDNIDTYGERVLLYDMPYSDSVNEAQDFGDVLLARLEDPLATRSVTSLTYYPEKSAALTTVFEAVDIGHRIATGDDQTGVNKSFFVNKITVYNDGNKLTCVYGLCYAPDDDFMILNDATYGVLDAEECRLSY